MDITFSIHTQLPKKEGSVIKNVIFDKNNIEYDGWYSRLRLLELSMKSNKELLKVYRYIIDINDEVNTFIMKGEDTRKKVTGILVDYQLKKRKVYIMQS